MDEEHRQAAFCDLRQRRGLAEIPPVFQVAQPAGRIQQRECRQPERRLQFLGELVPDARIAAIFDKAPDVGPLGLARGHHRRGSPHRDAMHDHPRIAAENPVGNLHPVQQIEAVEPPHADCPPFALPVVMQIRQQDVIPQVMVIEVADHQHPHGAVRITVDDNRRAVGRHGSRRVEGVQPDTLRIGDHGVAQRPGRLQTVHPRAQEWVFGIHIFIGRGILFPHPGVGTQREREHIETPADNRSYQQQDKTGNDSRNSSRRHNFWL